MKNFIINNSKLIITISIVAIAITYIANVGLSYAKNDESGTVYTRDELSEKVEELFYRNDYVKFNTNHAKLVNAYVFTSIPIQTVNTNTNENLFTFEDGVIKIHKTGNYLISLYTSYYFMGNTGAHAQSAISINGSSVLGQTTDYHELYQTNTILPYTLQENDEIGFFYYLTGASSNMEVSMNAAVIYLS